MTQIQDRPTIIVDVRQVWGWDNAYEWFIRHGGAKIVCESWFEGDDAKERAKSAGEMWARSYLK